MEVLNHWHIIPESLTAIPTNILRRNCRSSETCADAIQSSASLSCGARLRNRGYTRCVESLWRVLRREGLAEQEKPKKKYKPKPYEQMQYPGQRVQIDVKVVPRSCIADPLLKLYQYTAIDEYSRYRILGAYAEQSTYSSADFLRRVVTAFQRKGVKVECVQTDNGFEFTNRFSNSKRDIPTLFEDTAKELGIRHKLIRPYTPRHNGKVERSHREDQKRFYACHRFWSLAGLWSPASWGSKVAATPAPCALFAGRSPRQMLACFTVQNV